MPEGPLARDDLVAALHELADVLNREGVKARLYIVGGAAMVLGFSARDMTRDVDARYYPKAEINRVATEIAKKYRLPQDWLNDNAAMFVSPVTDDDKSQLFLSLGTVTIRTASAEALLAMKIRASRQRIDNFDIEFLCEHLKVSSVDQAVGIFEKHYPEDPLPEHALPILTAILENDPETPNPQPLARDSARARDRTARPSRFPPYSQRFVNQSSRSAIARRLREPATSRDAEIWRCCRP